MAPQQETLASGAPGLQSGWANWLVLAAAILLPVALAALILLQLRTDWNRVEHEVRTNTLTLAQVLSEHTDRLLEKADLVRLQTESIIDVDDLSAVNYEHFLQLRAFAAASPYIVSVWVGDASGRAVLTSRQFPAPDLSASDRDYFAAVRDNPAALFVGTLRDNRYTDEVLINTSRRLNDSDGNFAGFIQVALGPEAIRQLFRRAQVPYQVAVWWLDPEGVPLMREPFVIPEQLQEQTPPAFEAFGTAPSGSIRGISGLDGTERHFIFSRSPQYGHTIVVAVPHEEVVALWSARAVPTALLGGALLVALLTILALVRRERNRAVAEAGRLEKEVAARTQDLARAVQERELLFDELRHRVGNAFATVQALAHQMLRHSDDFESFRATFPARLAALASTQTLLIAREDRRAPIDELVWRELGLYRERGDPGIVAEGPPIALAPQRATAAGLILHELATNAVKYGALSLPEGRLTIRWSLDDAGRLVLRWRESGGPPIEAAEVGEGFGSQMLERAAQLNGGEVRVDFTPDGVDAELTLPVT